MQNVRCLSKSIASWLEYCFVLTIKGWKCLQVCMSAWECDVLITNTIFSDQQIFPGLILSDIKPAKRMKFKTVCYLLVQLMHCRKMFKAEIPFSNVMTCEDDDKVVHVGQVHSLGINSRTASSRPCFRT